MLKSKKLLALLFAVVMLIQTLPITGFAADVEGFVDFPIGSWSEEAMTAAVDNGLLVGTSETTIEPRKNLTRAEFAAIVTRAFGATEKADISKFEDVDADMWYAEPIAKVVQMGVMNGTGDTTFAPNSYMKREDVILALARVLFVNGDDTSVLDQFSDKAKIDNWSVKAIAGMVSEGYVHGYEDGTIRPLNYITREELAQLFHNIFKTYISEDGEFDSVAKKGSVIVRSKYVTLKDVTIDGDLIMADGIGDGDFRISNVHVTGKIIARGGEGMNYFVNVTADGKVIVNDPNGVVNFYNYREEDTPFKGGNVIENTPATFLERKTPTSPSIGGGGGADYDFYIYDSYESITNNLDPEVKLENKGASYKIKDSDVPTEIDGKKVAGWYKEGDIEFYDRSDLVGKKIKDVEGKWYPAYLYTINFVTDSGTTSVEKIENKAIEAAEIPVITTDVSKEFKGWSTTAGSLVPEYTDADLVAGTVKDVFGDETEVTLYPVIVDKDAVIVVFKHPAGDVEVTKYDPDYVLTDSDIPADPTKADHTFKGWSKDPAATTGEDRSYFVGKKISAVEGTWYPVFEENLDEYTITFVTDAGNEVVTKTEGETIADSEIPAITVDASKEFMGWTTVAGSTNVDYTNAQITADVVENVFTSTSVTLYPVIKDKDSYSVIFKPANAGETDKEVKKYDPDYVLTDSDVPADPTKADHVFAGWAKDPAATTGEDRSYFVGKKISEVEGTWYPIFTRDETTYSVSFKYEDGTEALPTVEKSLVASEDYVLTNADVKDVAHPTAPADYKFLGWSEAGSTVVVPSADLEKSIRDLDGKIYYAQFEKISDVYTIIFKDNDENDLATLTKNEDESIVDSEIPAVSVDASSLFKGWATTKGATTVEFDNTMLVSDVVANVFTSTTVTLYPVIVPKDAVEYFIEHYFEDLDGNYVLDSAKTQNGFEIPGKTVTATALTVEHYEENLTHADRLAEGIVPDAPEVLTLKFFYDLEVLKVNYYDLAVDEDYPVLVYDVKYGGTIDNFCYEDTAFDAADNDAIKAEIKEYVEYIKMAGYGKNYDDEYFFTEFDDTMGSYYYPGFGAYDHQHEINFKWYVEDAVEEYVVFDEAHVFTEDLDLFSKVKKLNAVVEFPSKLTDEVLTLNIPYEEHTRFLDSVRDALYINDHVAEFPEMAGVEDDMYDKLSDVGGRVFGDDGIFNDEYEINNTDVMIYFYQMMGGKAEYRRWLWNEVESSLRDTLGRGSKVEDDYMILRNTLPNDEIALKTFFEDNYYGLDFVSLYSVAYNKYIDSRNFINDSSEKDEFLVTANNEFIMEKVDEKIRSLASLDAVIDEYGGGRVPEGLLNRLPMDIVKDIYEPRVQRFLDDLDAARDEAKKASPDLEKCKVDSGIIFDINLVEELLIPGMEFAEESHTKAVNKAVASGNKAAELIEKYYVDNPYVTGAAGNYGAVNYAFEPSFYVEDTDGDGLYTIKSFYDIYTGMVMPEAVESVDALLWYMDPEGGAVEFSKIRNLAEENEALILALHNHPHALMAEYAENGLPETMEEYWEDLLSDPEIKKAVEKIDNKVSFDMMYFVEDKINNATLEMYFLKVLNKVGVPAESLLSKYTGSKAYKELTSEDFNKLLDQLEECWETVDVDGEMVENANGTTDYVFDNVLDKVGSSGDVAEVSIKGFAMTITRFFADDLYQVAP